MRPPRTGATLYPLLIFAWVSSYVASFFAFYSGSHLPYGLNSEFSQSLVTFLWLILIPAGWVALCRQRGCSRRLEFCGASISAAMMFFIVSLLNTSNMAATYLLKEFGPSFVAVISLTITFIGSRENKRKPGGNFIKSAAFLYWNIFAAMMGVFAGTCSFFLAHSKALNILTIFCGFFATFSG